MQLFNCLFDRMHGLWLTYQLQQLSTANCMQTKRSRVSVYKLIDLCFSLLSKRSGFELFSPGSEINIVI